MSLLPDVLSGVGSVIPWMLLGAVVMAYIIMRVRRMQQVKRRSRMLSAGLRDIGEFAVEEARCTLVHCTKEPRRFFGRELPLMRERCIFTIDAVVKIGFDFDAIEVQLCRLRREITLRLPAIRLLSTALDYDSMHVLDEKTGMFAVPKLEWHRDAMQHLTQEAIDRVCRSDAFSRAQASAVIRLEAFVGRFFDLSEYRLNIVPAEGTLPAGKELPTGV